MPTVFYLRRSNASSLPKCSDEHILKPVSSDIFYTVVKDADNDISFWCLNLSPCVCRQSSIEGDVLGSSEKKTAYNMIFSKEGLHRSGQDDAVKNLRLL